ncbi:MAG: hypothetical protein HY911_15965 [Desulfobacterales bacterium]|nr:hypothetical protein [Desulfobacterales bacterium]
MKELKEKSSKEANPAGAVCSRRSVLRGSAALLAGGIAGLAGCGKKEPQAAPPLPWKWTKLDPNEAGRRAYRNYLTNKG